MQLSPTALDRLLLLCVKGRAASAQGYVATMLPRGADLAPLREQIEAECSPAFRKAVLAALPWLAQDAFMPRPEKPAPALAAEERADARERLAAAGAHGLPARDLTAEEIATLGEDIAEFDQPTGGRPRKMVRLREFDPRHNIWARPI